MPLTVDPVVEPGSMSSIEQPTLIVDDALALRPFAHRDRDAVTAAFSDPQIIQWHGFSIDSPTQAAEWIDRNHQQWRDEACAVWAAVDVADQVRGRCALHVDLRGGTGEIAYWVLPEHRGGAVATRSAERVTRWGHEELGIRRILLQHSTANGASCAVAEKLGYRWEGTAREADLHADGWHDMHQHAHLAHD